jgi:hypothetical protein
VRSRARVRRVPVTAMFPVRARVIASSLVALVIGGACIGCAPAMPMMLGGRTTPLARVDLGVGGAARVPLGDLAPREVPAGGEEVLALAEPGGVAPVAFARWGLVRRWHAGALVSGSTLRLEVIGELRISTFMRIIGGLAPYGGYARSGERQGTGGGEGYRLGALAPLAIAIELGGAIEGWLGGRLGFEHVEGAVGAEAVRASGSLTAFRGGLFVGIGGGFRHLHVLAELAADYEYWRGALGGIAIERMGIALTPGFAIRLRF